MYDRKQLKKQAKHTLKKHYLLFVVLCLLGTFMIEGVNSTADALVPDVTSSEVSEDDTVSGNQMIDESTVSKVVRAIINGDFDQAKQEANKKQDEYKNEKDTTSNRFGHTQGVLAKIVTNFSSGTFFVTMATVLNNFTNSSSVTLAILIALAGIIYVIYDLFAYGLYSISSKRMLLEAGEYDKVPLSHAFYSFTTKTYLKLVWIYFVENLYLTLWYLTIIGGIIKSYSYAMVDYIAAENPNLSPNECITLSRKMMDGHKWEMFKLDLSMIGWDILDLFTIGVLGYLFIEPYKTSVKCEYYKWLRSVCKENNLEGIEVLNDTYLYEQADDSALQVAYADITEKQTYIQQNDIKLTGVRKFFAENFALWIGSIKDKVAYQNIQNIKQNIQADQQVLNHKAYPVRLSPLYKPTEKKFSFSIQYMRCYTVWSLVLFFFLFSFIGWCWEVLLMLQQLGKFVNRGLLLGPWLPIYGTGGLVALLLLARLRKKPPVCFIGSIILSGILEYTTSWYLEMQYHQKWWDYTGYFLNLDGRICAEGLLIFGIGCSLVIFVVGPLFDSFISRRSPKVIIPLSIILIAVFGCDAVYSHFHPNEGEGVTGALTNTEITYVLQEIKEEQYS